MPVRKAATALLCAAALAAPRLALACSVCSAGREDETQTAFLLTTVFLSLLPLSMFAGLFLWLRRRHKLRERTTRVAAAAPAPSARPGLEAELRRV